MFNINKASRVRQGGLALSQLLCIPIWSSIAGQISTPTRRRHHAPVSQVLFREGEVYRARHELRQECMCTFSPQINDRVMVPIRTVKIEAVSDMLPFVRSMGRAVKLLELSQAKFKLRWKSLRSRTWGAPMWLH